MASRLIFALCTTVAACAFAGCTSAPSTDAGAVASDTTPAASATTTPPMLADSCKADAAQRFVGQKATADVVEAARVASGAATARVLTPDMAITMEYRGDRLNLRTGTDEMIASVNCG